MLSLRNAVPRTLLHVVKVIQVLGYSAFVRGSSSRISSTKIERNNGLMMIRSVSLRLRQ